MDDKLDHSNTKSGRKKALFWLGLGLFSLGLMILTAYRFLQVPSGRTNVLVLGMAGGDYTGRDLTDTIIFCSINNQTGETLVLSLPRDIWVTPLRTKLNSVYHYRGMEGTKEVASEILGQPVDQAVLVDFELFTNIVDLIGGVEVEVERSFDDPRYPISGRENDECGGDPEYQCRYEHIHFEAGLQHMDGTWALKYVRSRFAGGEEGTDFARSQRQQRLLLAIRDKIFSSQVLLHPEKLKQLFQIITANIKTDIPQERYLRLFKIGLRFRSKKLKTLVLGEEFLVNPPPSQYRYDNQWILVPKTGDWDAIQEYVAQLLEG